MLYRVPQTRFQHTVNVSMSDTRGVALFIMAESESVQANTEHKRNIQNCKIVFILSP